MFSAWTFLECAVGIGTLTIGSLTLPLGPYHLFIDGQAGSDCTWDFKSELLCDFSISGAHMDESCGGKMYLSNWVKVQI